MQINLIFTFICLTFLRRQNIGRDVRPIRLHFIVTIKVEIKKKTVLW